LKRLAVWLKSAGKLTFIDCCVERATNGFFPLVPALSFETPRGVSSFVRNVWRYMMVANGKAITRTYIGSDFQEVCELPNLIGVQLDSYERFLQLDGYKKGEAPNPAYGLEKVFQSTFPIEVPNGEMRLVYKGYKIDLDNIKFSETECKKKDAPTASH
jgi:hypothetical protein